MKSNPNYTTVKNPKKKKSKDLKPFGLIYIYKRYKG